MFQQRIINKTKHIRFRQWSRKGYAVFAGLKQVISIGRVKIAIAEISLLKTALSHSLHFEPEAITSTTEKEQSKEEVSLQILQLVSEIKNNFIYQNRQAYAAVAAAYNDILFITTKALKRA